MKRKDKKKLRKDIQEIFQAGLLSVDPYLAVKRNVTLKTDLLKVGDKNYRLSDYQNIYVIGFGKAGAPMAKALEEILKNKITAGLITVKYGYQLPLQRIEIQQGGHPVPDESGMKATRKLLELVKNVNKNDLVICLISGGGSALLVSPVEGISLRQKQKVTQALLACGATIQEMNTIRKHVSRVKGGNLAKAICPATLISLILSDVIGDPLDSIASGPTVPDETSFADCVSIIDKYNLKKKIPAPVLDNLEQGSKGKRPETPKLGDGIFKNTYNKIIANNSLALKSAAEKARKLGYRPLILSSVIEGETSEIAKMHLAIAKEIVSSGNPIKPPCCLISGGETTVTIKGKGLGGRNQEFVLASAIEIEGIEGITVLSGGTDGTDGPTDAAGAIADGNTVKRAVEKGMNPHLFLKNNDSYHFFKNLGDLLITGPTNTNVMDLRLILIEM